jgi:hypothetical protein
VLPGVDRRASFYGLPNGPYDPQLWRPIRSKPNRNSRGRGSRRASRSKAKPAVGASAEKKAEVKAPKPPRPEEVEEVQTTPERKEAMDPVVVIPKTDCNNSWCSLTTLIPPSDPFWKDFMESIDLMKFGMNEGGCLEDMLQGILARHPKFSHPIVVDDVVQILRNEARDQDEVNIFDEYDQFFP